MAGEARQQMTYNQRTWLNPPHISSTGSIVCFNDSSNFESRHSNFIEFSDCKGKITLHPIDTDTPDDWIAKVELLRSEIDSYLNHIKQMYSQTEILLK